MQGPQKKKKMIKDKSLKDKVPKIVVTVFDHVDLKTLKRNHFAFLNNITDLGTTCWRRNLKGKGKMKVKS